MASPVPAAEEDAEGPQNDESAGTARHELAVSLRPGLPITQTDGPS